MKLDENQQRAVETTESRVLVAACPGSGKTRVITERFAHMIDVCKHNPYNMVLLTFTRYAANEMKGRIGPVKSRGAFIGTFHSFALHLIEMYGTTRQWEPEWITILDEEEAQLEQDSALRDLGIINTMGKWSADLKRYDWEKFVESKLTGSSEYLHRINPVHLERYENAWKAFYDRLRSENCLTYGTMILEAMALIEDPITGDLLRKRYQHFLVDEAQDSDANQWNLVELFRPQTLFVVGDGDQSIYSWRGGRPDLFLKYAEGSTQYQLPRSYRFGFNLAAPANELIKRNVDRIDIAIEAISDNAGMVQTVKDAEFTDIADILKEELLAHKPTDIAILSRRHVTLDALANTLEAERLPFVQCGGQNDITKRPEFRIVRGLLRLAVNPLDRRAFMAVVPALGYDTDKIWEVRSKAVAEGISLLKASGFKNPQDQLSAQAWLRENDKAHVYDMIFSYLNDIVYREAIVDTAELVKYLALADIQDQMSTVNESVTLSTIHGAKGLEWPVVLIAGMNADNFPSKRSIKEGRAEEERRLFYVAITRAEKKLYIIQNTPQHSKDGPSMFLSEIGELPEYKQKSKQDDDNLVM